MSLFYLLSLRVRHLHSMQDLVTFRLRCTLSPGMTGVGGYDQSEGLN